MVSTLDNALQALFSMAHKELLWKNASPASSFAEQNLSVNTTGYELILVTTTAGSAIMEYGDAAQIVIDYGAALTQRSVTWTNRTTININDCIRTITYGQTGSRVTLNTSLIPQAIYGIKL